jgi:hypothetical protein
MVVYDSDTPGGTGANLVLALWANNFYYEVFGALYFIEISIEK